MKMGACKALARSIDPSQQSAGKLHSSQDGVLLASYHDIMYHVVCRKEKRQEAAVVSLVNV